LTKLCRSNLGGALIMPHRVDGNHNAQLIQQIQ